VPPTHHYPNPHLVTLAHREAPGKSKGGKGRSEQKKNQSKRRRRRQFEAGDRWRRMRRRRCWRVGAGRRPRRRWGTSSSPSWAPECLAFPTPSARPGGCAGRRGRRRRHVLLHAPAREHSSPVFPDVSATVYCEFEFIVRSPARLFLVSGLISFSLVLQTT
jgi:hypothetical protein